MSELVARLRRSSRYIGDSTAQDAADRIEQLEAVVREAGPMIHALAAWERENGTLAWVASEKRVEVLGLIQRAAIRSNLRDASDRIRVLAALPSDGRG